MVSKNTWQPPILGTPLLATASIAFSAASLLLPWLDDVTQLTNACKKLAEELRHANKRRLQKSRDTDITPPRHGNRRYLTNTHRS
ncbi:MAG: hypothetical protein ACTSYM_03250 [Candidatus Baldrarchaeia archaeon]